MDSLKGSLTAVNGLARDTGEKAYGAAVGGTQSLFSRVQAGAKTTKEVLDGAARDVSKKFRLGETHCNRIRRVPLVRTFDGSSFFGKIFH